MLDPVLETFPLWLVTILLLAACLVAREAGVLAFCVVGRRAKAEPAREKSAAESHIVGAVFGLLSFIVALAFSMALDRHAVRGALVTEEAAAISAAYLSAGLLDEPGRSKLQTTLRSYARGRISSTGMWDARTDAQLAQSRALRLKLMDETTGAVEPIRATDQASHFLQVVNELVRVGARREEAGRGHIPPRIVGILFIYLISASAVMGYLLGHPPGVHRQASTALVALFSVVIVTVVDIDRPQAGAIRVSQRALTELVATLDQSAAGTPPRSASAS